MNLDSLAQELDRLYQFEISEYIARCDELKKSGYKIYRNDNGMHKVVLSGQSSGNSQRQYGSDNSANVTEKKESLPKRIKNRVKTGVENFKTIVRIGKFIYNTQKNNSDRRR